MVAMKKYDTLCKSCGNVICDECRTKCCSNYVPIQTDNIKELIAKESTAICQIAKENQEIAADLYEKEVHEQQIQYKAKSETPSKISIFFGSLKTKFLEHLREQEKILQEEINEFYSKNEDQLDRKIRPCWSATEKLDQNMDLLGAFEKAPVIMSQFRIMDLVKNEISKCKSKMPTLDSSTVQFCPEESEIQTLFGIKPCSLKFSDGQHDIVLDAHRSQKQYKLEDFTTANVSQEPESSTISNTADETVNATTMSQNPDRYNALNASSTSSSGNNATPAGISTTAPLVTDKPSGFFEYGVYVKTFRSQLIDDLKSSKPFGMYQKCSSKFIEPVNR
jgi:hypothetical protein